MSYNPLITPFKSKVEHISRWAQYMLAYRERREFEIVDDDNGLTHLNIVATARFFGIKRKHIEVIVKSHKRKFREEQLNLFD